MLLEDWNSAILQKKVWEIMFTVVSELGKKLKSKMSFVVWKV
jgi:hypothetical protein